MGLFEEHQQRPSHSIAQHLLGFLRIERVSGRVLSRLLLLRGWYCGFWQGSGQRRGRRGGISRFRRWPRIC